MTVAKRYKGPAEGSGTETNPEYIADQLRKHQPWDLDDYARVRRAALEVVRTLEPVPMAGGTAYVVNGTARWELLGALDRANERTEGQSGQRARKPS